jgi:hypothetical protein
MDSALDCGADASGTVPAARCGVIRHAVEPQLPPDVQGMYVHLPMPQKTLVRVADDTM